VLDLCLVHPLSQVQVEDYLEIKKVSY
jgi:hypothetical protein